MQGSRRLLVVILYTHALLGEGVAQLLAGEPGLDVKLVPARDHPAAAEALASDPDVVIYERSEVFREADLRDAAPNARLFDVSLDAGRRTDIASMVASPDEIFRVLREMRRGDGRPADGVVAHPVGG